MGSGAKGHNFVFARVSPTKEAEVSSEAGEGQEVKKKPQRSQRQPPAKKPRVSRTLDENTKGTIFNLL